jgi:outer membrane protein assembly factor BamA
MASINAKVHQQYEFRNVYLQTNFKPTYSGAFDTVLYIPQQRRFADPTLYYFITPVKVNRKGDTVIIKDYRYKIITNCIRFKAHDMFNQDDVTFTYDRFNEMRNFVFTDISFFEPDSSSIENPSDNPLDSRILLTRAKTHSPVFEITARTDKMSTSIGYLNRNLFKGAEMFRINIYAATDISTQKPVIRTLELGGDVGLDFPRLLFFPNTGNKISRYKTSVNLGANYQKRVEVLERFIYNTAMSYHWNEKLNNRHIVVPIDLGFVKVNRFERFNDFINDTLSSRQMKEKYTSHILTIARYTFSHASKPKTNRKSFFNIQLSMESCGNTLTAFMAAFRAPKNNEGQWTIFGVQYANYLRFDADFRYNYLINRRNSVAARLSLGAGIPLFNSTVMPLERSFYLGGSNSMRGWEIRSLGPGSYYNNEPIKERVGDLKLEMNLEYRGTIYKFVKFGIFADAGNIWLYKEDPSMPNGEFRLNRFYKEIALNVGTGLRFDFNFFLLRLDLGIPIYDPNKLLEDRVINQKINLRDCQLQFGINHAF